VSLTHLDDAGRARMVDIGAKPVSRRRAVAEGRVLMSADTVEQVRQAGLAKGDVRAVAEVAGVMAAKRTSECIPLCHPVPLDRIAVHTELVPEWPGIRVTATAEATARTGVEMEALMAVSMTCLTIYDMVKAVDRGMQIDGIRLLEKTGGTRGPWRAADRPDSDLEDTR
jgi:cyclic pyranopterin monophosphate synthase